MLYIEYHSYMLERNKDEFKDNVKIVELNAFPTLSIRIVSAWNQAGNFCNLSANIVDGNVSVYTIAKDVKIESIPEFDLIEKQLSDQRWGDFYLDMLELHLALKQISTFIYQSRSENDMLLQSHILALQSIALKTRNFDFNVMIDLHKNRT